MTYKITKYDSEQDHHYLESADLRTYRVDITASGEIPDANNAEDRAQRIKICHSLIGKSIYIKSLEPYCYIGNGIEIIE